MRLRPPPIKSKPQGTSGLGLEAQRKAIDDLVASRGADVIARFTEVESGKKADRPELAKALHLAKVTGAVLLIAKLDRLSGTRRSCSRSETAASASWRPTCPRPTI
jgi:DNA invertase Pin-like site-specific DNA recombinase